MNSKKEQPASAGRMPRLVGRFRELRRALRPEVGDRVQKRFSADSGITEVLVTAVNGNDVEWKRHFFHDSGSDWELDRPRASYLRNYRKMMINSLLCGCEFIPANVPAMASADTQTPKDNGTP